MHRWTIWQCRPDSLSNSIVYTHCTITSCTAFCHLYTATLRPNFSVQVQGQTRSIRPKKCQNAKPKISKPRAIKKCQIWLIWPCVKPNGNPVLHNHLMHRLLPPRPIHCNKILQTTVKIEALQYHNLTLYCKTSYYDSVCQRCVTLI